MSGATAHDGGAVLRVAYTIACAITFLGFIYLLCIENYLPITVLDISKYAFSIRSVFWIAIEGFFAVGFSISIVYLTNKTLLYYFSRNTLFVFYIPLCMLIIYISCWQTLAFSNYFYPTGHLEGWSWFAAVIAKSAVTFSYSVSILGYYAEIYYSQVNDGAYTRLEKKEQTPFIVVPVSAYSVAFIFLKIFG